MKDLVTGIVAGAFSAFYLVQTSSIKIFGGATAGVTAQTIPRLWGGALLLLSIILILRSLLAMRRAKGREEQKMGLVAALKERREVVCTFVLLILYAVLMKPVGFIIMSMLYVYLQSGCSRRPRNVQSGCTQSQAGLPCFSPSDSISSLQNI